MGHRGFEGVTGGQKGVKGAMRCPTGSLRGSKVSRGINKVMGRVKEKQITGNQEGSREGYQGSQGVCKGNILHANAEEQIPMVNV